MDEFNPYAAPKVRDEEIALGNLANDGVWQDGPLVVMTKTATLPDRCLKCNAPATYRLKRNLSWHPQWYYLIVLYNVIIYLIVALCVRWTAKVTYPLCTEHRRRRRNAILVGWLTFLLGWPVIVVGVTTLGDYGWVGLLAGVALILFGLIYGVNRSQVVSVKRINKHLVWLAKVNPDFRESLPPFPG